eukprot:gene7711-8327_t
MMMKRFIRFILRIAISSSLLTKVFYLLSAASSSKTRSLSEASMNPIVNLLRENLTVINYVGNTQPIAPDTNPIMAVWGDSMGNLYTSAMGNYTIAGNHLIRKVSNYGQTVQHFAGDGSIIVREGVPAVATGINNVVSIIGDSTNNIIFVDQGVHIIRKIDAVSGNVTTIAGIIATTSQSIPITGAAATMTALNYPFMLWIDPNDNLYVTNCGTSTVIKFSKSGREYIAQLFAGSGNYMGTNLSPTQAKLSNPTGIWGDEIGNVFISDQNNRRIVKVDCSTNRLTTIIGGGNKWTQDDWTATGLILDTPNGLWMDNFNQLLYFVDKNRIKVLNFLTGNVSTVVNSDGGNDNKGNGVSAINASLVNPIQIWGNNQGKLFIADYGDSRIRTVDLITNIMYVYTDYLFGNGGSAANTRLEGPMNLWGDSFGNLFYIENKFCTVRKIDPLSQIITSIGGTGECRFDQPQEGVPFNGSVLTPYIRGIWGDSSGEFYYALDNGDIKVVLRNYNDYIKMPLPQFSSKPNSTASIFGHPDGSILVLYSQEHKVTQVFPFQGNYSNYAGNGISQFNGDGRPAVESSLNYPNGMWVNSLGITYIADTNNNRIRSVFINQDGVRMMNTIAGSSNNGFIDNCEASSGVLNGPYAVVGDSIGNLFIADTGNRRIRMIYPVGDQNYITTIIGSGDGKDPLPLYTSNPALLTSLAQPVSLWFDPNYNLYYLENFNSKYLLRKAFIPNLSLPPSDVDETIAERLLSSHYMVTNFIGNSDYYTAPDRLDINSIWGDSSGNIYASTSNSYVYKISNYAQTVTIFAGDRDSDYVDNVLPTETSIGTITCITGDSIGNIYFVDQGYNIIRKIDGQTNIMTTIAGVPFNAGGFSEGRSARFSYLYYPNKMWIDSNNNIYVLNTGWQRITFLKWNSGNDYNIFSFAGGGGNQGNGIDATEFYFQSLTGITGDTQGNIYVSDASAQVIYRITDGIVSYAVGGGSYDSSDIPLSTASLSYPTSLMSDTNGNLFFIDSNRVKRVSFDDNTLYNEAGNGDYGFSGDGNSPLEVSFSSPSSLWIDSNNNMFIADSGNSRIRLLSSTSRIVFTYSQFLYGDGGPAINAQLGQPKDLWGDTVGNLFYVEQQLCTVRKVDAFTNIITTFGGNSQCGLSISEGLPLNNSQLVSPLKSFWGSPLTGLYYALDSDYMVTVNPSQNNVISLFQLNGDYDGSIFGNPTSDMLLISSVDEHVVRAYLPVTQELWIFAGTFSDPSNLSNGYPRTIPAISTSIGNPLSVWVDPEYNVYFIESYNSQYGIRKGLYVNDFPTNYPTASPTHVEYDVMQYRYVSGVYNSNPGSKRVNSIWVDTSGNIYTDADGHYIRRISAFDQSVETIAGVQYSSADGIINDQFANQTYIASLTKLWGDSLGNLYYVDRGYNAIVRIDANTQRVKSIGSVDQPGYIWGNTAGQLFVSESSSRWSSSCVRQLDLNHVDMHPNGSVLLCGLGYPTGVWGDTEGMIYVISQNDGTMWRANASFHEQLIGQPRQVTPTDDDHSLGSYSLSSGYGLWVDSQNIVYFCDYQRVLYYDPSTDEVRPLTGGSYYGSVFGDGGPAKDASCGSYYYSVNGLALNSVTLSSSTSGFWIDTLGCYYFFDRLHLLRVNPNTTVIETVYYYLLDGYYTDVSIVGDIQGNFIISIPSQAVIKKVTPNGAVSNYAGIPNNQGFSGDGVQATSATLYYPLGIWMDSGNNLYIADQNNHRVRRVAASGIIQTIAGTGSTYSNYYSNSGDALSLSLYYPKKVTGDNYGNIFVSDYYHYCVHMLSPSSNGGYNFRVVVGSFNSYMYGYPTFLWMDNSKRTLYVAFLYSNTIIYKATYPYQQSNPTTQPINVPLRRNLLEEKSIDNSMPTSHPTLHPQLSFQVQYYVSSPNYQYQQSYEIHTVWGNTNGDIYYDVNGMYIRKISRYGQSFENIAGSGKSLPLEGFLDGKRANETVLYWVTKIWGDTIGNLYYADASLNLIVQIEAETMFTRVVATVNSPTMMWGNTVGQLFVTESGQGGCIRQIDVTNIRFAHNYLCGIGSSYGIWGTDDGTLYFIGDNQRSLSRSKGGGYQEVLIGDSYSGNDDEATFAKYQSLYQSNGLWIDTNDGIYFTVQWPSKVMYYDPLSEMVTPVVGSSYGGFGGDGNKALDASLNSPMDVWGDTNANIFIADTQNCRVRKVDPNGIIYTVIDYLGGSGGSATNVYISQPSGMWGDKAGNLFYVDRGYCVIRKVDRSGTIINIAGTWNCGYGDDGRPANATQISDWSFGFWGDEEGNYYYLDNRNLRKIESGFNNVVTTLYYSVTNDKDAINLQDQQAQYELFLTGDNDGNLFVVIPYQHVIKQYDISGNGFKGLFAGMFQQGGYNGDGPFPTEATLNYPASMWIDGDHNVFIADQWNHRIRMVDGASGYIRTIAGTGNSGYNGDKMEATNAWLNNPCSITGDGEGTLFVVDRDNQRVRILTPSIGADNVVSYTIDTVLGNDGNSNWYFDKPFSVWMRDVNHLLLLQRRYGYYMITETHPEIASPSVSPASAPYSSNAARRLTDSYPTNRPTQVPTYHNAESVPLVTRYCVGSSSYSMENSYIYSIWGNSLGELFTDANGRFIRKVTDWGRNVTKVAGNYNYGVSFQDNVLAKDLQLWSISKLWGDSTGNLYFIEQDSGLGQINLATGVVRVVAWISRLSSMWGNSAGQLFVSERSYTYDENGYRSNCVYKFVPSSNGEWQQQGTNRCGLQSPTGIWGDSNEFVYVISQGNGVLFKANFSNPNDVTAIIGRIENNDNDASWSYQKVRKYNRKMNEVTGFAGNGNSWGDLGDGKLATQASLSSPTDVWGDTNGNLFIADSYHYRVRKVDTAGIIQTVVDYQGGDFGPASLAYLGSPVSLRGDSNGNIYVVDQSYCIIRKVNTVGIITTIGGAWSCGSQGITGKVLNGNQLSYSVAGLTLDTAGNFYFLELDAIKIARASDNYNVSTICSGITKGGFEEGNGQWVNPSVLSLLRDDGGNFFVLVPDQHVIKLYRSDCEVQIVAGVYGKYGYNGDELSATSSSLDATSAALANPSAVVGDSYGNLFIADCENARVRLLKPRADGSYIISTIIGNSGSYNNNGYGDRRLMKITTEEYYTSSYPPANPHEVWLDSKGDLYVLQNLWGYNMIVCAPNVLNITLTSSPTQSPSTIPTERPSFNPTVVPSVLPTYRPSTLPTCAPTTSPTSSPTQSPSVTPTISPTLMPSSLPSINPTFVPTFVPTYLPTLTPSFNPTAIPSDAPSFVPTAPPTTLPTFTPTHNPSELPTEVPSVVPTVVPTLVPSTVPSFTPTRIPTSVPSLEPTTDPTASPSAGPSAVPTFTPTFIPTVQPTTNPTASPSAGPSAVPTFTPTFIPTVQPTTNPTASPSAGPSAVPTFTPTFIPTVQPTTNPTASPSAGPSAVPTFTPTFIPTVQPTTNPTASPSAGPSAVPTFTPTFIPTVQPTTNPTASPSAGPSAVPTFTPTFIPTVQPTTNPTASPSAGPSAVPTFTPTFIPTVQPTTNPTASPSAGPSAVPTFTPTFIPTVQPTTNPTASPSAGPSAVPTFTPTFIPTVQPTTNPTASPSAGPSAVPTFTPTFIPTVQPTTNPTASPSAGPSAVPTFTPTFIPTVQPTTNPTASPSAGPSAVPTFTPTVIPTAPPSIKPSKIPSAEPSTAPTFDPTAVPSVEPSAAPTFDPTAVPSVEPSAAPTFDPSVEPSIAPTFDPTAVPSVEPSIAPTFDPTAVPSVEPTFDPTAVPSVEPSAAPTFDPTAVPSVEPSAAPTFDPTAVPSVEPSAAPTFDPSVEPSAAPTFDPTAVPSVEPSAAPTFDPTAVPSVEPSALPTTLLPSFIPSFSSSKPPTFEPSENRTAILSVKPTYLPTSMIPTTDPSVNPTHLPSFTSSNNPTFIPTLAPSLLKTQSPTAVPSCAPSGAPVVPLTPALIVNTVITVSNSSITTQILLSNDGIVSGGLFVVDAIAPSISQIVSQNINCVSQNKKCTVTFRSLIAATEYNVYFYTKSVDGVAMSADQVLQTKQAATTACCKPISISLSTSRLVEGQSYANLISASVTSLPKTSLSLTLWLGQDLSPRTIQNALVPSQIAFAATSSSSYRIGLSSQMMGRYYLGVSLTGVEASSYQVVFEGLSSVSSENAIYVASFPVLPSNASLPAPMLSRASFSNDGASVIVELDSTSNLAGMTVGTTFACNQLFDFLCVASAKCQWVDGKTIYASVPTSSSCALNVGNYIKFSSSAIIKAPCTSAASCVNYDRWPSSNTTKTVMLSTASSPVTPSVVLSIPKSIGACSPLSIDLTSSSGNGGRAWKSISITVASSSSNSTLLNQLRSFLSTIKTVNPPTVVAARYFTAGDQYSFTARLCNFLDQCGQTAQTLTIVSNTIPLISIAGASIVTLTRSQPLSLITNTQLSSCSGTASAGLTGLSYSWSVAVINDGNSFTKLSGLVSTSKDPSRFLLPAFSLTAGLSYQITVNVTYIPSGTFSIASAQLVVPQGKVKAVIAGSSQQNVRVKESLILDASRSYDEDVANSFGTAAGLQYQWSCVQTEPVLNNSCAAIFDMAKWTASITTGSMLISTLSSASNTKAQVTVLIVDKTNTRSSSVTIVVSVLPALLPTISLTASSSQINAGQTLQITGTVNYPASIEGNATWQILSGESGRNLSSLASTGLTQQFLRSSSAQSYSMYLVIPPNRLTIGTTYTFGLLAFSSYRGMSTLGSISVTINSPPVLGSFSISPTSGEQLLQMQVYASKTTSGSNNSAVTFISKSLNPSKWTSVDDILQGTAIASYLLNQANCSLPSNYCTSRNRKPCATTSLTCGPCLSSAFVGTAGDSNDHCYSLEELKARAQVNNTLPLSTKSKECAGNCSSHGVCAYTSVKSGAVIGQCYEGDLSCSASCICSPGYTLSNNCELSDAEVEQKRNLREQVIAGIQQYVSLQDANEQSVSSWIDSMNDATQNPNELSEHSVSTVLDVANYAIKVATENGFDSSSLSSIVTSLDALASAVALKERRRRLTSGSSSNNGGIGGVELMQTLSNYSQLIGQQMLPGQEATSAVQSNFRFVVQSVASTSSISSGRRMLSSSAACASNISITLPQSSLEQFVGTEESAIRLPTCPEDQTSALSISVVSLSSTLYDAALFKSDPVSLHLSSTPCTDPENCNAEIVLQSDNLGRGVTLEASNVTYKCEAGDQAKHEVSCPGGKKYEITCDGKGSTVVATCPAERAVPTCNGLFGSATSDIGCKVVASSDTTTTCSCPIVVSSYLSPERRALSSNSSIISGSCSVTYLGMLRQVTDTFQATVLSAADLNASTIERSWMSLVTVGSLVVAFVVALIISHYTDAKTKNKIAFDEK